MYCSYGHFAQVLVVLYVTATSLSAGGALRHGHFVRCWWCFTTACVLEYDIESKANNII